MIKLYPHQEQHLKFYDKHKRVLEASDMGVGKTLMALAYIKRKGYKALLVVPAFLMENWRREALLLFDESKIKVFSAKRKEELNGIVNITSYSLLAKNLVGSYTYGKHNKRKRKEGTGKIDQRKYDILVCDEAHYISNRNVIRSSAIRYISRVFDNILLLTGTPVRNYPDELWHLLKILRHEYISNSYWEFVDRYCKVFEMRRGRRNFKVIVGSKNEKELKHYLDMVMIRHTLQEVTDLPPVVEKTIYLDPDKEMKKYYNQMIEDKYLEGAGGMREVALNKLSQDIKLRQITLNAGILNLGDDKISPSIKDNTLLDLLNGDLAGKKVVIFTYFKRYANYLQKFLEGNEIRTLKITGDITSRQAVVDKFKDDNYRVLVSTIGAGGTGLNIQFVDTAIFTDITYVPADKQQAIARLHRIGQKSRVLVINLVIKGSIEEEVIKKNDVKQVIVKKLV